MQDFARNLCRGVRLSAYLVILVGAVSVGVMASPACAQISPDLPNPSKAQNPLTATLSLFRNNMQDKIAQAADMMP